MFNYSPLRKRTSLWVCEGVTVLGEEEVLSGCERQAEVTVTSATATLFPFCLSDLAALTAPKTALPRFIELLKEHITRPRLAQRRQKLSSTLRLENKRNLNYFYMEGDSASSRPRTAK